MRITLATGREVSLSRIDQWRTYGGLLCGRPDERTNRLFVEELLEHAQRRGVAGAAPYFIEPDAQAMAGRLPAVACVAVFDSGPLERDDSERYSSLVVAWFQDGFALPIDARIDEQIRRVDWEGRAQDWCW